MSYHRSFQDYLYNDETNGQQRLSQRARKGQKQSVETSERPRPSSAYIPHSEQHGRPAPPSVSLPPLPNIVQVKSKFDSEYRRFAWNVRLNRDTSLHDEFRKLLEGLHGLHSVPFTLCYTAHSGDLLPITNDQNLRKSLESARPTLRLLIQRKGESWEEKYGYGTDAVDRRHKGLATILSGTKNPKRNYSISNPEDFRQVSAIIDVDIVPEAHRRVRLCKHGAGDRPLGFYIRDGDSVRVTSMGVMKVTGIFISRLVEGGLAESTGLLAVNDEILEVNGIEVAGKTLDQVTDMMVANATNLIVTVRPSNQRTTLQRSTASTRHSSSNHNSHRQTDDHSDDEDEVVDYSRQSAVHR